VAGRPEVRKGCYELLRAAYVKARYARHYRITAEEPNWIGSRVVLRGLIEDLCLKRIEALKAAACNLSTPIRRGTGSADVRKGVAPRDRSRLFLLFQAIDIVGVSSNW